MNFQYFKKKELTDFLREFFLYKIIVSSSESDQFSKHNSLPNRMENLNIITN